MKKWIVVVLAVVIVAVIVSGVMIYLQSNRNFLSNADEIQKKWMDMKINQESIHVLNDLKTDNIDEINPSLVNTTDTDHHQENTNKFQGSLTVQITVNRGSSVKDRITMGRQLMELLFSNKSVNKVGITIYQKGDDHHLVQMATDKDHFAKRKQERGISSGLKQIMIIK